MKTLAILGASGHGKVVADIALASGWDCVEFYDDSWPNCLQVSRWSIVGDSQRLLMNCTKYQGVIVGIGHNETRLKKACQLEEAGAQFLLIQHPSAVLSPFAVLGKGTVVMPGAMINVDANIGRHCIINTGATIDHDCLLADGVHISPGAHLAGTVTVGDCAWIGIGASVHQQRRIGKGAVVGAGAAVIKDVQENETVAGVPARRLK